MEDVRTIKALVSQIKKLRSEADSLKIEVVTKQKELDLKKKRIISIQNTIDGINSSKELKVSEHAIVRYFERVKGFDIADIENDILSEEVLSMVESLGGTGGYPNKDFKVLIKDYTVTTIV